MTHPPIPQFMAAPRPVDGSGSSPEPRPWKILVADDEPAAHHFARHAVRDLSFEGRGVQILDAYSGGEAVELCRRHPDLAVLLLDVVMESRHAGLQAVRRIRDDLQMRALRIVLNTGQPGNTSESEVVQGYDINDYRSKVELTPQRTRCVLTNALRAFRDCRLPEEDALELQQARLLNTRLREAVDGAQDDLTGTIFRLLGAKSRETAEHVQAMGALVHRFSLLLGMEPLHAARLGLAARLHDVGKVGVPDEILNKPGRLTPHEMRIMQRHTILGREILSNANLPLLKHGAIIAHQHHERWDGRGYPHGLKGEDIHRFGRISAICDVFDALSRPRIYRSAMRPDQVYDHLKHQRARAFDPELLDLFLEHFDDFLATQQAFAATEGGTSPVAAEIRGAS